MKNLTYRKRLLPLFLLFAMLMICGGCALQLAKEPVKNEEVSMKSGMPEEVPAENTDSKAAETKPEVLEVEEELPKAETPKPEKAPSKAETPKPEEEPPKAETQKPEEEPPKAETQKSEEEPLKEEAPKPEEVQSEIEEIPDQIDMEQLGDWYMSNEEYDEMVSNSDVGVGEN